MAPPTSYWLRDMLRVWLRYFAVVIASVPAGLVYIGLLKAGLRDFLALSIAVCVCLSVAYLAWKILDKRFFAARPATTVTIVPLAANTGWEISLPDTGIRIAGSLPAVIMVASYGLANPIQPVVTLPKTTPNCAASSKVVYCET